MTKILVTFFLIFAIPVELTANNPSLVGTRDSLRKQNEIADKEGLVRIKDDQTLEELKRKGTLVKLPDTVQVDHRLDEKWHWSLEQTSVFLENLGIEFINKFGRRLKVNSAVRTVERQIELAEVIGNNNAKLPLEGPRRSPHPTGATVDIAKKDMNKHELEWIREKLLKLEEFDLVEATEEHHQLVFHVMVFSTYLGESRGNTQP